jgi:hypothetical protein
MTDLLWSASLVRAFKRKTRRHPELRERIGVTLRRLAEDPFRPLALVKKAFLPQKARRSLRKNKEKTL